LYNEHYDISNSIKYNVHCYRNSLSFDDTKDDGKIKIKTHNVLGKNGTGNNGTNGKVGKNGTFSILGLKIWSGS